MLLLVACGGDAGLVAEGHNDVPRVELIAPEAGTMVFEGESVLLRALFSDPDGDDEAVRVLWSSSLDGPLEGIDTLTEGEATLELALELRPGVHTLVALAVDTEGGVGLDDVELTVVDPDRDGDGFWSDLWGGEDCRDDHPGIHPDAVDDCDGVDQDCDGQVDEDAPTRIWYPDEDLDGHGAPEPAWETCTSPEGWALDGVDCDDHDDSRIHCLSCLAILGTRWDQGDGLYTIDPLGSQPFQVLCDQAQAGGGWTLVATNAHDGAWNPVNMLSDQSFGVLSDQTSFKSPAFSDLRFADLRFENADMDAVYLDVDLGDRSWQAFQAQVDFYNCGEPSWELSEGSFDHPKLCDDAVLHLHTKDQDGGIYGVCTEGNVEFYGNDAYGPTWSVSNNHGCPMDDPYSSGFVSANRSWGLVQPLRMWVR